MILDLVAAADTILARAIATVAIGSALAAAALTGGIALIRHRITARRAPAPDTDDYQEAA